MVFGENMCVVRDVNKEAIENSIRQLGINDITVVIV